jgi:hypothetical protein
MEYSQDQHPRDSLEHDLFLVRKRDGDQAVLDHFRVVKASKNDDEIGRYLDSNGTPRPPVGREGEFHRPVMNLAFPTGSPVEPKQIGPVFSALPVHPDPAATSACTCYLVNVANLRYQTVWTSEEWNQVPGYDTGGPDLGDDGFDLLIATPAAKVYRVTKKATEPAAVTQPVNLKQNPELWMQLRNGCVVGRARYNGRDESTVLPLVNIHSLQGATEEAGT